MSPRDTGLFTQALALANWHANHSFSPASGEPTHATSAGWVRTSASNQQMFPRTDVAVIVLVTDDDDRILLGNNAMWESNRFSLLAGYVDPGESLEAAVEREVLEESGLRIDRAQYISSQPWPFPASLMVGFVARVRSDAKATDIRPDGEEILSLRWFSRAELRDSLDDIILPGLTSIARSLIEQWFGEPLDQDAVWLGIR
jgi:NAD+ diphosphatase